MSFINKALRKRRATLPSVPRTTDREQQRFLAAVKDALEVSMGDRGDGLDANPTWRDLVDTDLVQVTGSRVFPSYSNSATSGTNVPNLPDYGNESLPSAPSNFAVTATINNAYLTWDTPSEDWIEFAEIYHIEVAEADPDPVVEDAAFLGRATPLGVFQHGAEPSTRNFYWVRFVSYAGNFGPWHSINGVEVTIPEEAAHLLNELSGQISSSELQAALATKLDASEAIYDELEGVPLPNGFQTDEWNASYNGSMETLPTVTAVNTTSDVNLANAFIAPANSTLTPWNTYVWEVTEQLDAGFQHRVGYSMDVTVDGSARQAIVVGIRLAPNTTEDTNYAYLEVSGSNIVQCTNGSTVGDFSNRSIRPTSEWTFMVLWKEAEGTANTTDRNSGHYDNDGNIIGSEDYTMWRSGTATEHVVTVSAQLRVTNTSTTTAAKYEFTHPIVISGDSNYKPSPDMAAEFAVTPSPTLTRINLIEQKVTDQGALWHVTQDVDGYVTGFGLYNNGSTSTALFRVDQFAVGSPTKNSLAFVIDGNDVVMNAAYIQDATITDAKIANVTVDKITGNTANFVSSNIGNATITNAKIADGAITTAKIGSAAITAAKIADANVTNAKIANAAITNAKIGTAAVDTLKIGGNAITALQYSGFSNDTWIYNFGGTRVNCVTSYFNHGHSSSVDVLIRYNGWITRHSGNGGSAAAGERWVYIRINSGSYYYPAYYVNANDVPFAFEVFVSLPSGSNRIDVYSSRHRSNGTLGTTGGEWQVQNVGISIQAAKR